MTSDLVYPAHPSARSRWILQQRGTKAVMDPWVPAAFLWEEECDENGELVPTVTLFLTNRECPFRCLMCDLWRHTLDTRVPSGAIVTQIRYALDRLPPARQIKLYNSGSFFDPQAIPPEDDRAIAKVIQGYERVIVESHPRFLGERAARFRDRLPGKLEIAVGLETVHPETLERLNKRITVADFKRAAQWLSREQIALRVFLLLRPPFQSEAEGVFWAERSVDAAFDAGATACCVIPTRSGNGAMEALAASGDFASPNLRSLEAVQEYGLRRQAGRVFSDLWDIERFFTCRCSPDRARRLAAMNQGQTLPESIVCDICEEQHKNADLRGHL